MFDIQTQKNWPKTRGIYSIENKTNGKIYVGQTLDSLGFKRRWSSHRTALRKNRHDNYHLQSSYNKNGEDSFIFKILEEIEFNYKDPRAKALFKEREEFWMIQLGSTFPEKGYNTNPLAEYRRPGQNTKRTLPFFEFLSPNGEIISGQNIGGFARDLGIGPWGFRELAAGRKSSYMGYKTTDPELLKKESDFKYCLISPNGEKYYFNSMGKFAKEHGMLEVSLGFVISGKSGHCMGWRLENPDPKFASIIEKYLRKIFIRMEDGEIHQFPSEGSIVRKYNISVTSLRRFLRGERFRCPAISKWSIPTQDEIENSIVIEDGLTTKDFRDNGGKTAWGIIGENKIEKPVDCFDLDRNFVASYPSVSAAQRTITYQRVRKAVTKPFVLQAGGFYWKLRESN